MNDTYSVDILINDKPIRKFSHNGKIFIEARKGQEYSIRIKNNTHNRILSVTSVDGLDVLSGKIANEDANGYVINGYNSLNLDGFRVSDEKVAKFVFDYKDTSYAASKADGSERNVGVIGVRLFQEKIQPPPPPPIEVHHHHNHWHPNTWNTPYTNPPIIWCDTSDTSVGPMYREDSALGDMETYDCNNIPPVKGTDGVKYDAKIKTLGMKGRSTPLRSMKCCTNPEPTPRGFDMGTKWGEAKESRVIEVEFEKGILALTTNIYYASRQSLIEMGVPLGNEKQVSFPDPFADNKYAKPPKNWKG